MATNATRIVELVQHDLCYTNREGARMDTPAARLIHARELAGFSTAAEAIKRFGWRQSTYMAHENGQNGIRPEPATKYAKAYRVSAAWLLTGEGKPRRSPVDSFDPFEADKEVAAFEPGVSSLLPYEGHLPNAMPDIDVSAGAGPGGLPLPHQLPHDGGVVYAADAIRGEVILPDYLLGEYTRAKANRVHVVRVRGDSMETTLSSGDRVLVDTTDTSIGQGGVFVILDPDGEVLIKRLRKLSEGRIEVVSDNPKQATDTHAASEVRVIGRAVARLCRI
ncbi:XRE family transcriptional regulator [Hansschlegelia sp.]|uniref:XRE family transcriptional regulator n=1 Tax=Hansschlegelia sp. TaxID=2041892 RepID=UPI002CAB1ABF|nr:S24 family peptidase [Hansschlegelia sp.]HVI30435.1 S24 family peptidase [Hansschlegelia sp.]